MYKDKDYILQVNNTYSKTYSKRQMLPKFIIDQPVPPDLYVLDYGAGKDCYGTQILRSYFENVTAYDIGKNFVDGLHNPNALDEQYYDIIMMSNVINIQPSIDDIINVLYEAKDSLCYKFGSVYCNLPDKPRKSEINNRIMKVLMKGVFEEVEEYKNNIFRGERVC